MSYAHFLTLMVMDSLAAARSAFTHNDSAELKKSVEFWVESAEWWMDELETELRVGA